MNFSFLSCLKYINEEIKNFKTQQLGTKIAYEELELFRKHHAQMPLRNHSVGRSVAVVFVWGARGLWRVRPVPKQARRLPAGCVQAEARCL